MSKYSGAKKEMMDILDYHRIVEKYHTELPSLVDRKLLEDSLVDSIGKNMEQFIKSKTKQVQIDTSKRVIK